MNPVYTITSHFFNVALTSVPEVSTWSLHFKLSGQNVASISRLSHAFEQNLYRPDTSAILGPNILLLFYHNTPFIVILLFGAKFLVIYITTL
jgi:hypothetical protein